MALETANVLDELGLEYEIIIVDDGSTDDTPLGIEQVTRELSNVKAITSTRTREREICTKERVPRVYRRIDVHSVPKEIHRPCNCNKTRHRGGRGHLLA
jgi:glycosyltransferase involved in cell wall biosynthesis